MVSPLSSPPDMIAELNAFWSKLEEWPSEHDKVCAIDRVEDHYTLFAPRFFWEEELKIEQLLEQVNMTKKSAQGMDGWTVEELKALPPACMGHLLALWPSIVSNFAFSPPR